MKRKASKTFVLVKTEKRLKAAGEIQLSVPLYKNKINNAGYKLMYFRLGAVFTTELPFTCDEAFQLYSRHILDIEKCFKAYIFET